MKFTPFGEAARILRVRHDVSLKSMADAMGISSSHLSGIEYGEKTLSDRHVDAAISFFSSRAATAEELRDLRKAAERSKKVMNVDSLEPDARELVAAFARKLQQGAKPSPAVLGFLDSHHDL